MCVLVIYGDGLAAVVEDEGSVGTDLFFADHFLYVYVRVMGLVNKKNFNVKKFFLYNDW